MLGRVYAIVPALFLGLVVHQGFLWQEARAEKTAAASRTDARMERAAEEGRAWSIKKEAALKADCDRRVPPQADNFKRLYALCLEDNRMFN